MKNIRSERNRSADRDQAYIERANARWEAWTYSEGIKYRLGLPTGCTKSDAIGYLNNKHYDVIVVE